MILNETLEKHRKCLESCEIEQIACELEEENDKDCDLEVKNCDFNCDFDFGP